MCGNTNYNTQRVRKSGNTKEIGKLVVPVVTSDKRTYISDPSKVDN